jgi:hypothetical protein
MTSYVLSLVVASTPAALAVRVDGDGYLRFARGSEIVYAREARLMIREGVLVEERGLPVAPRVTVTGRVDRLTIDLQGRLTVWSSGSSREAGRLVLALLPESALARSGGFLATTAKSRLVEPGEGLAGVIRTGAERNTNVAAARARPRIEVRAASTTSGTTFTLGDIADLTGPADLLVKLRSVVIGETPAVGVRRGLDHLRIESRLRAADLDPRDYELVVPSGAHVMRTHQVVTHDRFVEVAIDRARKELGATAELEARTTGQPFFAPDGEISLVAESLARDRNGVSVLVSVNVGGKRVNSRTVLLGIKGGSFSFNVGSLVKLRVRAGAAAVETVGRVRQGGFIGQDIVVQTADGALLTGKGVAPGVVEVKA